MTVLPPAPFAAYPLRFELEAREPIYLHAHNGSALRGMLYRAVVALAGGDARAPDLRFVPDPLVRRLLAALDEENPRGQDPPRPYVIEPPDLPPHNADRPLPHLILPGQRFTFGVTLFGDAIEAFPVLVLALKRAEQDGLGRRFAAPSGRERRGRFSLRRAFAHNPFTRTSQELLAPGERTVLTPQVCVTHDDVASQAARDAQTCAGRLRIHFLTPTTLKAQGAVLRRPNFSALIHRLIERLTQLSLAYGGALLPCLPVAREAKNALLRQADAVQTTDDHTRWVEVRGHSDRTRASTNLGGFGGQADFAGDLAPFFAILRWGELAHVGHHAVKGNGAFRIEAGGMNDERP
ncbi:MAG: CRISPR system precrRNA processing endoribonuclease RAMP protein Cas6 [Thermoflexales bacterium]